MLREKEQEMKKVFLIILLLAIPLVCLAQERGQPLQLTIKSDKKVYEVGDKIKINYTISNIGNLPVGVFYSISPAYADESIKYKLQTTNDKEYELLYPYSVQTMKPIPEYKIFKPGQRWIQEKTIGEINLGKVHKMELLGQKGSRDAELVKTLYYEGFHIIFGDHQHMLVKNGFGKYKLSFTFCDAKGLMEEQKAECAGIWVCSKESCSCDINRTPLENTWQGCVESNIIELQIK